MLSETEIREVIKGKIDQDENLGEKVGESGHLGYTSYEIDHISKPVKQPGEIWKVAYIYTLYVETEFTYYPDNPPYEYKYKKTIFLDEKGKIVNESPKETLGNSFHKTDDFLDL
ncbi:MAG: hypothetical protein JSW11_02235 [Candidatus Heimdallarchaeota archaeon]|nr:MAG: hypothetical protein JSW11_02235 [Candidatus Heimdallarchaeota archaeon]